MAEKNMQKALDVMRHDLDSLIDMVQIYARLRKEKFDALVSEGFSKDEALAICISTKVME